jgi:uncharacterized protein YdaU (DUF1376 family)
MSENLDWFPLYWRRFLLGTAKMKAEEIGAYMLLLIHQWEKCFVPLDEAEIEEIAKLPVKKLSRVLKKFSRTEDGYQNEFLEEVRAEQYTKLAKSSGRGKKAAEARWGKKAQAMHMHSTSNATAMHSDAIRREEKREEEKRGEKNAPAPETFADEKTETHSAEKGQVNSGIPPKGAWPQSHQPVLPSSPGNPLSPRTGEEHVAAARKSEADTLALKRSLKAKFPAFTQAQFDLLLDAYITDFDGRYPNGENKGTFLRAWGWYVDGKRALPAAVIAKPKSSPVDPSRL